MATVDYAELHCLSNFTFLRGASRPEELVERATELGYAGLALTDECSVAGVVRAHVAARGRAPKLVIGSEFAATDGLKVVVLAPDRAAYGALCNLISSARQATGSEAPCLGQQSVNIVGRAATSSGADTAAGESPPRDRLPLIQ